MRWSRNCSRIEAGSALTGADCFPNGAGAPSAPSPTRLRRFRAGVTTRLRSLPGWKRSADFLFVQVSFDLDALLAWRETVDFDGAVYAGVMVLPSASMAGKLMAAIPEITVPPGWLHAMDRDRTAGTKLACDLAQEIAESGVFDGVHLIPGARYREAAASLEKFKRGP